MASIVSLPNELKDLITAHLSCHDFVRLSQTCRELHAFALPLAYQNLTLTWVSGMGKRPRSPRLVQLLRTLVERPDHAEAIKNLTFDTDGCMYFDGEDYLRANIPGSEIELDAENIVLLRRAMADLGLSDDLGWEAAVAGSQRFFVVMAMVVAYCVKLERLDLSVAFTMVNDWLEELVKKKLALRDGNAAWMENLKHVRFVCNTGGNDWTPGIVRLEKAALIPFYLPTLETLEVEHFEDPFRPNEWEIEDEELYEIDFWPMYPAAPPIANNLTTIRLLRSSAAPQTLNLMLQQTPNLRTLEFDVSQSDQVLTSLRFDEYKSALDLAQATLENLTIRFQVYAEGQDPRHYEDVVEGRLGSFRDYLALTHLEVSLHTLFGARAHWTGTTAASLAAMLPPNLQSLTITDDLWMFQDFENAFVDVDAMATFRRFLTGEMLPPEWEEEEFGEDWRGRNAALNWAPGRGGGEWKVATPKLKKFVYDLRKRGYLSDEYWNKGKIRRQFRNMCKEQGLEGEVLWETIQYVMASPDQFYG
jgi:hypothetical protein